MELPQVGHNCALAKCGQLDFLPFVCQLCHQTFCLTHRLPLSHQCPSATESPDTLTSGSGPNQPRLESLKIPCANSHCRTRSITIAVCPRCRQGYCFEHRHPDEHQCHQIQAEADQTAVDRQRKREAIRTTLGLDPHTRKPNASLAKTDPPCQPAVPALVSVSVSPRPPPAWSNPRVSMVELMKLKTRATGNPKTPVADRLYFRVRLHHKPNLPDLECYLDQLESVFA
ncbi:AN1-type zinc finger protein 1 [Dimargaris cristalligena]|nr:AN1-type zinc finger protein 1 [Dimargaris cristalligena]